jgi:hypothetical protein
MIRGLCRAVRALYGPQKVRLNLVPGLRLGIRRQGRPCRGTGVGAIADCLCVAITLLVRCEQIQGPASRIRQVCAMLIAFLNLELRRVCRLCANTLFADPLGHSERTGNE